ncbi:MAG: outer membrane protein assembly factor BamB [Pseudomonadota bacterium]|nr:outer membrane protein assembly factor BamB [Pseudomonadota bacterium]
MKVKIFILIQLMFFVAGCSTVKGVIPGIGNKDDEAEPAELETFAEKVKLQRTWKASSGKIIKNNKQIQPILVDTTLYTASSDGVITAFEADSGKQLWRRKLKIALSAGIGYGDGLLLAGTENGEVVALYASNGNPAWVGEVKGGVLASPEGGQNIVVVPTSGNQLVGLSATDGSLVWNLQESTPRLLLRGRGRPLVVSDVVFAGFDNGKIILIRLDNGQRLWDVRVGDAIGKTEIERLADVDAKPIIINETVYTAAYQSRVIAINAPTADMLWENKISTNKDMDVDKMHLYVIGEDDVIFAINLKTGETVWEQDRLTHRGLTSPAVLGDYVLTGDKTGYLHVLEASTGEIVGRVKTGAEFIAQPVTRGLSAWIQSIDGDVYAWKLAE